jgi:methionine-S-sulfoxide reductase
MRREAGTVNGTNVSPGWRGRAIVFAAVAAGIGSAYFLLSGTGMTGKTGSGEPRLPAEIPRIDRAEHVGTEMAIFAMGCFWSPDSRFGSLPGVVRTRVGYSGGTARNPSYRVLGDHIESVEVEFDPAVVSYESLLEVFWAGHDPTAVPWKRQYLSAIFPRGEEQRMAAVRSKEREGGRRKGRIFTKILPESRFHPAEAHHQKFALRGKTALLKEFQAIYPEYRDFMASTAVTRVNGYAGGHGTCEALRKEIEGFGLSPEGRKRLEDFVCSRGTEKPVKSGDACPTG